MEDYNIAGEKTDIICHSKTKPSLQAFWIIIQKACKLGYRKHI